MASSTDKDIGRLEGRMASVEKDLSAMKIDMRCILKTLNEARGGWKTLLLAAGVAGTIGAVASKLLPIAWK
ncbi:MAG: hypothetical protein QF704_02255 [Anaerolineales bacterium]|jgi:hypothetical protein|nr:hypothetical protein [Anaerolineales bacterium]|tara:strand:+ start:136 stop:348 length:213 start_codon:yes stop_codon:yes gene_type:complete